MVVTPKTCPLEERMIVQVKKEFWKETSVTLASFHAALNGEHTVDSFSQSQLLSVHLWLLTHSMHGTFY